MGRNSNGRVHPSPSSAASSNSDYLSSVLTLLPAAILALTTTLTSDDQEVLAYMIKSTTSSSSLPQDSKKKATASSNKTHSPAFSCDCFHCYTSYWSRWDSSASKDLIHQVIEDYETHLANKSKKSGRSRRRSNFKMAPSENPPAELSPSLLPEASVTLDESAPEKVVTDEASDLVPVNLTAMEGCLGTAADGHRGLGRKVFPDVMGLFNSRIWSFWSPKF